MHEIQSEHWTQSCFLGVLVFLDCQASFCLFVDCVKVFEPSDLSRADDISYIDFSFTRIAEEATIVYAGLQKTSGDTHRCLHSMLDLGNPHMLAGAEWWMEEYKPRPLACEWDPIKEVTSSTTSGFGDGPQSTLLSVAKAVPFRFGITTDQIRCTSLTSPFLRTRLDCWRGNETWLLCSRIFRCRRHLPPVACYTKCLKLFWSTLVITYLHV
jgi:hypothetical protein